MLEPAGSAYPELSRNFAALRLRDSSFRYDAVARLNLNEHVSFPADVRSGKAMLELRP